MHGLPPPTQRPAGSRARREWRWRRRVLWPATAAVLLRSAEVGAAAYLPRPAEPDPPTGEVERRVDLLPDGPTPDSGLRPGADSANGESGTGVRWVLAPVRVSGLVSLDGRWLRLDHGSSTRQALVFNDIEASTYIWQPWFVQLRGGLGLLAARDVSHDRDAPSVTSKTISPVGRFQMSVFPASRFPFELRAEVSDSRVAGDTLGVDYRSERYSLHQSYRPLGGQQSYSFDFERSRLSTADEGADTLSSLQATATRQWAEQSLDVSGSVSVNERSDDSARSRLASASLRHAFRPSASVNVDTLASVHEVRLRGGGGDETEFGSDLRQLSTFATWRPRAGDWLQDGAEPMYVTASARVAESGASFGDVSQRTRSANASLGLSRDLPNDWRLSGAVSAGTLDSEQTGHLQQATGNLIVNWVPDPTPLGDWRYSPTLGFGYGVTRASELGERVIVSGQASQGLARDWVLQGTDTVSLNLTQSVAMLHESVTSQRSTALAHSAAVYWQTGGTGDRQGFVSLSASDARTRADEGGSFQIINLQVSERLQTSRHAQWSGSLTWQATRSDLTLIDPFDGLLRTQGSGWQRFYGGSLAYEHRKALGVPQLRYTLLLTANSQQIERRALGDLQAPLERVSQSVEQRLDYMIGRLEARVSARAARIEERTVTSIFVRLQRRY